MDNIKIIKEQLLKDLQTIDTIKKLNDLKIEYLGKKGKITTLNSTIKSIDDDKKKEFGIKLNDVILHCLEGMKFRHEELMFQIIGV